MRLIRNVRKGLFGQAGSRQCYRQVAEQKRLLVAGVERREILGFYAVVGFGVSIENSLLRDAMIA